MNIVLVLDRTSANEEMGESCALLLMLLLLSQSFPAQRWYHKASPALSTLNRNDNDFVICVLQYTYIGDGGKKEKTKHVVVGPNSSSHTIIQALPIAVFWPHCNR